MEKMHFNCVYVDKKGCMQQTWFDAWNEEQVREYINGKGWKVESITPLPKQDDKKKILLGSVIFFLFIAALIFFLAKPKPPQPTYAVQLNIYDDKREGDATPLVGTFAVINSESPKNEELDNEIKAKIEKALKLKKLKVVSFEEADFIVLPFYWAQRSGNDYCASSNYEADGSINFVNCEKIKRAHPYLWDLSLRIYNKKDFKGRRFSDSLWNIEGTSKIRVKNYRKVVDGILNAFLKHFHWEEITYRSFVLDWEKDGNPFEEQK